MLLQVYDLEKRQQAAAEREARKAAKQALHERQEREHQAKLKMEEDAYEMQLQVHVSSLCCFSTEVTDVPALKGKGFV